MGGRGEIKRELEERKGENGREREREREKMEQYGKYVARSIYFLDGRGEES